MSIVLNTPGPDGLGEVIETMRDWQHEGAPIQLHPGDIGWHWRFGAESTAAGTRTWSRDGRLLAVAQVDQELVRLAIAPDSWQDEELAHRMAADVSLAERGLLPSGEAYVEARWDGLFHKLLRADGWGLDEPWVPLVRELVDPVPDSGLRVEVAGPEQVAERVAVQRASFPKSTFTAERWHAMATGTPYADARCLLGYDPQGAAVATVTVWSAGPGKPGLLEPLGVHHDHRGHGYGTAIAVAAAAALRDMGASSAIVCAEGSNTGAVATYRSAGFRRLPDVRDLCRGN